MKFILVIKYKRIIYITIAFIGSCCCSSSSSFPFSLSLVHLNYIDDNTILDPSSTHTNTQLVNSFSSSLIPGQLFKLGQIPGAPSSPTTSITLCHMLPLPWTPSLGYADRIPVTRLLCTVLCVCMWVTRSPLTLTRKSENKSSESKEGKPNPFRSLICSSPLVAALL